MKKRLAILLLLLIAVGCGESERTTNLTACPDCGEKVSKRRVLITLGRIPLTFGSNSACSIRIPGVANVKYRFFMELDLVYCVDLEKTTIHPSTPAKLLNHSEKI